VTKSLEEIRAELQVQLRARQKEIGLITGALYALGVGVDELADLTRCVMDPADREMPVKASDVHVPEEEAQRVHDEIDQEAHGGEKRRKRSHTLTADARDGILALKNEAITIVALKDKLDCSKTWARVQMNAAEEKGMVELTAGGDGTLGVEKVWRYVVPSAQAAARSRYAATKKSGRDCSVPGTGKRKHDSKNKREVAKKAVAAGVPVTHTKSGHMKVGTETVSKSGSGRRRKNVEAAIKRQADRG
jgi:hypothetical protein